MQHEKKKLYVILAAAMLAALVLTTAVAATGASYNSSTDPIVAYSGLVKWAEEVFRPSINETISAAVSPLNTSVATLESSNSAMKSTLDSTRHALATAQSELSSAKSELASAKQTIADQADQLASLEARLSAIEQQGGVTPPMGSATNAYSVIYLTTGTELLATSVCSIILRSGEAVVVSPFPAQGLTDVTDGTELNAGNPLTINHEVIVPRGNDGRGIRVTSAGGAYFLVQGGYTLVS